MERTHPQEKVILPEFKRIPEGTFLMGSENGLPDEQPVHKVWLDKFEIAMFPVTNVEYSFFLEFSGFPPPQEWSNSRFNHPLQPVVSVNWHQAIAYCQWLSQMTSQTYRLPTEAEREKACRGGLENCDYPWGNFVPADRPVRETWNRSPDIAGLYPPNGFGLFDMEGNIHEWCMDWYKLYYYSKSLARNPKGPETGDRKVSRGGAWRHQINISRCSARSSLPPAYHYTDYGFRVVRECE